MYLTSRTPLRISLFGGGTDYPAYFERHPGSVIGFAINKYIYISALKLGAYVDYRHRISYSAVETVSSPDEIVHPVVKALFKYYKVDCPLDLSIQADMPASAGLGSSSTFTVGLINLLSMLQNTPRTRFELAKEAIHVEQRLLEENVGVQDQLHASFGGFNRFNFHGDDFSINPIRLSARNLAEITSSMMLIYTGIKRRASEVVSEQVANTSAQKVDRELSDLMALVDSAQHILEGTECGTMAPALAEILHESWLIKRSLSSRVSNPEIDDLYALCRDKGALGGKLCGAGGGGFLLVIVPPERRAGLKAAVGDSRCVDFEIDHHGSILLQREADAYAAAA